MKHILNFFLGVLTIFVVSCHPFDFDYARGDVAKAKLQKEYSESFAEVFGHYGALNIDPNHQWGFGSIVVENSTPQTRVSVPNANQWGVDPYYLNVPKPLTQNQKDFVTNWFTKTKNPSGVAVSWTDYFAQQVSSTENGRHMDALYDNGEDKNNHVYNFNSGNCGETNVQGKDGQWTDRIMFMQGQSTRSFSYHESIGEKTWYDHYVIVPGEVIDPSNSLAENGESIWGMYFLGFDYEAFKEEGSSDNIKRDWYFNDWIIKITPGIVYYPSPVRIMAEDLGAIGDFDFNDVVIDVYLYYNQYYHGNDYGIIVLQAAGGTMPLYIEANPNEPRHEVHEEFGVLTTQIVNTEGGTGYSVSRPTAMWRFKPTSDNPIDIKLIVDNTKENIRYEIGSKVGIAPGKFAVPTTVKWSPECINIKTTYPKFTEWVEDQNKHFWE